MTAEWLERLQAIVRRYIDPQRYEWKPAVDPIPTMAQINEVYGDPEPIWRDGKGHVSSTWERAHCHTVSASLIPGYDKRIYMHSLVAPHFREAMRRAVAACPEYTFRRIGCFNPRKMRHDANAPWSTHTWAIAFDINADTNKAFMREPGDPRPFEVGWDQRSDLPVGVVQAFESVGFEWGGRWSGYVDPMHFQLVRT